jgi:hypothetical protein
VCCDRLQKLDGQTKKPIAETLAAIKDSYRLLDEVEAALE